MGKLAIPRSFIPGAELMRCADTTRKPVDTTTRQACGCYLPIGSPNLGAKGVIMGHELHSGRGFYYDPFVSYGESSPSPHIMSMGASGRGKSSATKCYVLRSLTMRNRSFVILDAQGDDGKENGEWVHIAKALGVIPIRLDPGDETTPTINPLDPVIPLKRAKELVTSMVTELNGGEPLSSDGAYALDVAFNRGVEEARAAGRVSIISDILDALTNPNESNLGQRTCTPAELLVWGQEPSFILQRLTEGDLGGAFNGPTSDKIDLTGRLVIFDLSQIDNQSLALPLVMAVVGTWISYAWVKPDGVKRMLIVEEAWHLISRLSTASLMRELLKYGRRLGLSLWFIIHHLADLEEDAAGPAKEVLKQTDTQIVFGMKRDEALGRENTVGTCERLGMPKWAREIVADRSKMGRGRAIWFTGGRWSWVQHAVTDLEWDLVHTDRGMALSDEEIEAATTNVVALDSPLSRRTLIRDTP